MSKLTIRPDWTADTTPLKHSWEGMLNVDQFHWMVRRDMQEQLAMARDEIGGHHVRACAMYCELTRVYATDPVHCHDKDEALKQAPRSNFQITDYVMDSLVDLGLSPIFTTCFVPPALASTPNFIWTPGAHVAPPKDRAAWRKLVQEHVSHVIDRYGLDIVGQWYFEIWNEPNLGCFFDGSQQAYFELHRETHHAIKEVEASLRVGGPSTARGEWLSEFLAWSREQDCEPDFLVSHCYNNDSANGALSPFDGPQADRVNTSPNFLRGVIAGLRKNMDALNYRGEIHWNEWGRSWFPHDPVRESSQEAAFIVKTMAEVSNQADYFAYWNLSDIYDQAGYGRETFHGNYGMLNLQGLRKPNWHAHQLLRRLGSERVAHGGENLNDTDNAVCTLADNKQQVLVHAMSPLDTDPERELNVEVALPGGTSAEQLQLTRVDCQANNILRDWEALGSPAYLSREQTRALKERNQLRPEDASAIRCEGDTASFSLKAPGIALLEIG